MDRLIHFSQLEETEIFNQKGFGFGYSCLYQDRLQKDKVRNKIWAFYKDIYDNARGGYIPYISQQPEIIFLKSPIACQIAALALIDFQDELKKKRYSRQSIHYSNRNATIWELLQKLFIPEWEKSFTEKTQKYASFSVWEEVSNKVKSAIKSYLGKNEEKLRHERWSIQVADLNRTYYDKSTVSYNNEFLSLGLFEIIYLSHYCIVSELPTDVRRNNSDDLHSEKGFAVEWRDGFGMCFWKGVKIPKDWILLKDSITRETIVLEQNIERRRCLMEIIGNQNYLDLLNVICINETIDDCGNPMKLFKTRERDIAIDEYLYYLYVIDPSTGREYYISVPPVYDVHWAKKATFGYEKIQYRQGDVGLLNIEKPFEQPDVET